MHTTNLRKVGGSIMLVVPHALLEALHLRAGEKVGLAVQSRRLVVEAAAASALYHCDELLARQCKIPRRGAATGNEARMVLPID